MIPACPECDLRLWVTQKRGPTDEWRCHKCSHDYTATEQCGQRRPEARFR